MQSDDEEVGVLERVKLGIQICAALGQLHALEISHGALTASNVLQDAEGRAVLLDFGRRSFNTAARRDPQRDLADLAHLLLSMGSVPESLSTLLQSVKQGPAKQVSSAVALGLRLRQWLNDQSMARSRWSFKNWIRRR
jgi:tRNA A-37 threonylcarbamoyl transferase component Bud32